MLLPRPSAVHENDHFSCDCILYCHVLDLFMQGLANARVIVIKRSGEELQPTENKQVRQ